MNHIANILLDWHKTIDRDLPWKTTDDPYFIWLSEIILQQTRVAQGTPYFVKFTKLFPTVHDLANATQEEVYKAWEGLGYYSRARNLHASAKYISQELHGEFPNTYRDIIQLKGVGPYTAAAISSFAFGEDKAVLDGNVFRVLSRIFDVDTDILSTSGKKEFQLLADELLPKGYSSQFNQAIMDFGALHCVGKSPNCMFCPLQEDCLANKNETVQLRPVKKKAGKKKDRYFYFLVAKLADNDFAPYYLIEKRSKKDIWSGLYQFPVIIRDKKLNSIRKADWENSINIKLSDEPLLISTSSQILSHQIIHAEFYEATLISSDHAIISDPDNQTDFVILPMKKILDLGFPRMLRKFLDEYADKLDY